MACCWTRSAEALLPASPDTEFDRQLLAGFSRILEQGFVFRSSPAKIQRRNLKGSLGLVVQFSEEHWLRKRGGPPSEGITEQVVMESVDPEAFNFNKVSPAEKLCVVEAFPPEHPSGAMRVSIFVNVSPLAYGHVLLVPQVDPLRPQVLTEEMMLCGLHLLSKSGRRDFRLFFNSLLAFASVNHFHWQGMYLSYCSLPHGVLPIERAQRSVITGRTTEGCVQIELLSDKAWYCSGFVVTAGCKAGVPGEEPPADLSALAATSARLVQELQRRGIPHNVILVPPPERRRKKDTTASGMAHEDESRPNAVSPEIIILPRRPQGEMRADASIFSGCLEISGVLIASDEVSFNACEEAVVQDIFKTDVALPCSVLDELICKVAWLPT